MLASLFNAYASFHRIIVRSLFPTEFLNAVKEGRKAFHPPIHGGCLPLTCFSIKCFVILPWVLLDEASLYVNMWILRPVRWQKKLREPIRSRLMRSINLNEWSTDLLFSAVIYFLGFVALYDRERPALAGSNTDKFNFPIMVSYKCPSLLGNLSPVVRQADKQYRFCWLSDFGGVLTLWSVDNLFNTVIILPTQSGTVVEMLSILLYIPVNYSCEWTVCVFVAQEITPPYQTTTPTRWAVNELNSAFREIKKS